jgi:hypothetical protein
MTLKVDLVIVGMTTEAAVAATDAARCGYRVLIVDSSKDLHYCRNLRRVLRVACNDCGQRVSVLAGFEVLAVDGINAIEVVLIRELKTGRLVGVNTSAMLVTTAIKPGVIAPTVRGQLGKNLPK